MSLPPTVATWTSLFDLYLVLGTAAAVIVISVLIWNVSKKPTGPGPEEKVLKRRARIRTAALLLVTISVLSTVEIATFSSTSLIVVADPPAALNVTVYGQQFFWTFIYPNNITMVGNLMVPAGREVVLNITSKDVFHSLAIQQLDVAKDAIPGHWNQLWFEVPTPSNYSIACKELCGVGHFAMTGTLYVVNATTFDNCYSQGNTTKACYLPPPPVPSNSTSPATGNSTGS